MAEFLICPGAWGVWDLPPKDEVVFILGFLMVVVLLVCLGWRRETRKRWKGNEEQESGRLGIASC